MITETATPLEMAWTLFAVGCCPLCLLVLKDAIGDLRQFAGPRTEDLVLLAVRDIAIDGFVLYLLMFFAGIGVRAMGMPPPTGAGTTDPGATLVAIGIILAELMAGALVGWLAWVRHRVKRLSQGAVFGEFDNTERRALMADALTDYREGRLSAEEALAMMLRARDRANQRSEP